MQIKTESYLRRRARLKKDVGSGLMLFLGNHEVGMNYADNTYRFRQDSSFLYFFGLDYAGLAAIIDIDEDREIVFGDELTIDDIVWTGTVPTLHERAAIGGISDTRPMSELKAYLDQARRRGQHIHFLPPYRGDHQIWLWELLGLNPKEQTVQVSQRMVKAIVAQRIYKDEEEIRIIDEAVDMSTRMHLAAYRTVRPGIHEAEVAAAVEQEPCHALVGTHAVDGKGDIGEARMAAHVEQSLGGPHAVGDDGFAQGMGQLQVTQKRVGLDVEVASAQGVHAGFADGEYLWVLGAPLEQGPVARREAVHVMPGVKAHRVTAPW
jgi:hypothetical protein